MKRPPSWLGRVLGGCLLLLLGYYGGLAWLVPHDVLQEIQRATGGELSFERVRWRFPLTTILTGVRLLSNTKDSAFSIQRLTVRPRWLAVPSRTIWVDSVEIDHPILRLTRTPDGAMHWPILRGSRSAAGNSAPGGSSAASEPPHRSPWKLEIDSVNIIDGVVELLDQKAPLMFHGAVDHLSVVAGPVQLPSEIAATPSSPARQGMMSFAVRGTLVGFAGHMAPGYCSGWLDPSTNDLQASCQLQPIPLAAFDPYYHGPSELRVYAATLQSTSQWSARSNALTGRIQLELGRLTEGDLSIRGRTIVDVKRLGAGQEPRLTGEITLTGALDAPSGWRVTFLPGDDRVQQLVQRLLEHGVQVVKVPVWGHPFRISISPAIKETMTDIEAASREVQEALEILATPPSEAISVSTPPAQVPAEGAESSAAPAQAPETAPQSAGPSGSTAPGSGSASVSVDRAPETETPATTPAPGPQPPPPASPAPSTTNR